MRQELKPVILTDKDLEDMYLIYQAKRRVGLKRLLVTSKKRKQSYE